GNPNIATHLAILLKIPAGTITLGADMVVCYVGLFGGAPASSYSIPLSIPDNMDVTVGIAAVVECKHGRVFQSVFFRLPRTPYAILSPAILCTNTPSDGLGKRITIGAGTETI